MPKISTKRDGKTTGKQAVQRETASLAAMGLEQRASTDVSSTLTCPPPILRTPEQTVSRQEAEMFIDKLARTYFMHARILVKETTETEPSETVTHSIISDF